MWIKRQLEASATFCMLSVYSLTTHTKSRNGLEWLNYHRKRRMGGEGNGFYSKFKWQVSHFGTRKKNAAFWHTLIITTACVCVCIQSSASAQGYLCSIIVAHHWEGGSGMKLFFFFFWSGFHLPRTSHAQANFPFHYIFGLPHRLTSTTASERKRRQQHY